MGMRCDGGIGRREVWLTCASEDSVGRDRLNLSGVSVKRIKRVTSKQRWR